MTDRAPPSSEAVTGRATPPGAEGVNFSTRGDPGQERETVVVEPAGNPRRAQGHVESGQVGRKPHGKPASRLGDRRGDLRAGNRASLRLGEEQLVARRLSSALQGEMQERLVGRRGQVGAPVLLQQPGAPCRGANGKILRADPFPIEVEHRDGGRAPGFLIHVVGDPDLHLIVDRLCRQEHRREEPPGSIVQQLPGAVVFDG